MEFHVAGDHCCREFGIRGGTSTTASDGLGEIMNLRGTLCSMQEGGDLLPTFSQFLSATMSPSVARVSAPRMIPSLKRQPTMVVPVLVALGRGIPRSARKLFLSRAGEMIL